MRRFTTIGSILVVVILLNQGLALGATLTPIVNLDFSGSAPGGGDPNYYEAGGTPYASTPVAAHGGELPIFSSGKMYIDGSNSTGYRRADEYLSVPVGGGYTLHSHNYVFEAMVKPDYPLPDETLITGIGTNNGRSDILTWGVFDQPDPIDTPLLRISSRNEGGCLEFSVDDWDPGNADYPSSCADPCMIITVPSDWPAGQGDYSHVAMVYTYDSGTGNGKTFGYLNGLLTGVDLDNYASALSFLENIYIGSGATDAGASRGTGWKGWYDAVVVSTFPLGEEFDESEFVLVQYPRFCGDHNHQYLSADVTRNCRVDLEDFGLVCAEWLSSVLP